MKPEQINIAIADHLGWTGIINGTGFRDAASVESNWYEIIPNYHRDLNAMHEAEQDIWNRDWSLRPVFVDHLARIINPVHGYREQSGLSLLDATADQRAEALVKTIGKWKEEP